MCIATVQLKQVPVLLRLEAVELSQRVRFRNNLSRERTLNHERQTYCSMEITMTDRG